MAYGPRLASLVRPLGFLRRGVATSFFVVRTAISRYSPRKVRQPIPFGKYLLLDRISVGGMAEVFKAKSFGVEGFEKVIAIKRILPSMGEDRDFIKMFIDEAKIAGQLAHANVCQIFELGRSEGAHFIAMEYIWGRDLLQMQNRLKRLNQPMPINMACHIIAKVCEGLDYAHRKRDAMGRALKIVHRDCSPQNVLVSFEGEVKLIDFGIAKAASRSSRTMAGVLKGKFGYMSPEQVRGLPLDRRTDIFALGTILYESLAGARLFIGESDFSTLEKVRNVDITPPSSVNADVPSEVEAIVMRALSKDPEDRYQWASEMQADLITYLTRQDFVYTSKQLAKWIRSAFSEEHEHERSLMEGYKNLGRDGLIAGVPQAEAKLDVVEHLGEAGQAEDATVLGGPSFEDIIAEVGGGLVPSGQQNGNFGDEAPTELFGEMDASELLEYIEDAADVLDNSNARQPAAGAHAAQAASVQVAAEEKRTMLGMQAPDLSAAYAPPNGPPPPVFNAEHPRQSANMKAAAPPAQQQHAGYQQPGQHGQPGAGGYQPGAPHGNPGGMQGYGAQAMGSGPAGAAPMHPAFSPAGSAPGYQSPPDTMQFGSTQDVHPLPTPSSVRALETVLPEPKRKRPSLVKDIAIGVGIAAGVLGMFAAAKYLFFGKKPGTSEARATIAVLVQDKKSAEVYLDDEKVGVVDGEPLELKDIPTGTHKVRVTRAGAKDCERTVELAAKSVREVNCTFVPDGSAKKKDSDRGPPKIASATPGAAADAGVGAPASAADAAPTKEDKAKEDKAKEDKAKEDKAKEDKAKEDTAKKIAAAKAKFNAMTPEQRAEAERRRKKRQEERDERRRLAREKRAKAKADAAKKAAANKSSSNKTKANDKFGYFMAFTKPWAKVYINGRYKGMTPIVPRGKIKLKPGRYKITFKASGKKFDFWVTITAGKNTKLIKDLPVQ